MKACSLGGAAVLPVLLMAGCASTPTNYPIRSQIDGQRGFTMQGVLKFTGDPAKTRARIEKAFVSSCGGPAEITQLDMARQDSSVGLKFYRYDATARCLPGASSRREQDR